VGIQIAALRVAPKYVWKRGPFEFVTKVILTTVPIRENLVPMFGDELTNPTNSAEIEPEGSANSLRVHTVALFVLLLLVAGIYFFYLPQ
jgi:hypothetical protein